jgi:hypothetical protein
MINKHHIIAIVSFLLIPLVTLSTVMIGNLIDPEIAAKFPDYERNYRLITIARNLFLAAAAAVNAGLWFSTCLFLVKSKTLPYKWLAMALLGPFGVIILTMLKDNSPAPGNQYRRFIQKHNLWLRIVIELSRLVFIMVAAYQTMTLKREIMISYQAAVSGVSRAQIIDQQNASSGMQAFGEGLETLYLVVLFYLLVPVCWNLAGRLLARSRNISG